jgi:hypothetical protein
VSGGGGAASGGTGGCSLPSEICGTVNDCCNPSNKLCEGFHCCLAPQAACNAATSVLCCSGQCVSNTCK